MPLLHQLQQTSVTEGRREQEEGRKREREKEYNSTQLNKIKQLSSQARIPLDKNTLWQSMHEWPHAGKGYSDFALWSLGLWKKIKTGRHKEQRENERCPVSPRVCVCMHSILLWSGLDDGSWAKYSHSSPLSGLTGVRCNDEKQHCYSLCSSLFTRQGQAGAAVVVVSLGLLTC